MSLGRPPVILDIVEEHFEELDFLWELREGVIFAPDWNLEELAELEERAEAHLDGLRLAELHAVDIARPHLLGEHKFAATAATFVYMETGEPELMQEVVQAFGAAEAPARDGIRIGLRHSRIDAIESRLRELAATAAPPVRAAAADVLAFHRRTLPDIRDLLTHEDDTVRILAFGALGRGSSPLDPALITAGLQSKAPEVRRAVLEAAARSGTPGLDGICRQAAARGADQDPEALAFLGVLGDPRSFSLLEASLARPELAVAAIRGLGALGMVDAIPLLIQAMENPELAAAAGAAFRRITGASAADIGGERPEPPPAGTPDLEAEFGDDTPPPQRSRAAECWQTIGTRMPADQSYQAGQPISGAVTDPEFDRLPLAVRIALQRRVRANEPSAHSNLELEGRARLQRR